MKQTIAVLRKELGSYFGSPMAFLFVGAFLIVTLFTFFWVEAFFARGIADVRPLFRWTPVLLIFLVAALTMRQWSEEQQRGTLELLLTMPVRTLQLVLGKFLAVMILVAFALALTAPLPITVSRLGDLDWGPVIGGYLAALLLAGAYAAIGLFLSSRTDNQIVALLLTMVVGGLFYLIGSRPVTDFAGPLGNTFRLLGTGSRFASIERGVIDLRDLAYYGSLIVGFLALNVLSVDARRWSRGPQAAQLRRSETLSILLVLANALALNLWLTPIRSVRFDITENREYSLSPVTKQLLAGLREPLLLRAYISERTHPLLAPLGPQLADLLEEYEIAGGGKVTAEVVDPQKDPEIEREATQIYGIQPTPFQVSGRYETAVVNSYFDVLVRYGDQSETLSFRDLIEIEARRDGTVDVRLRNPEYDLTRAIKKVVYGFQSLDAVLAALSRPVSLRLIVTPETLPEPLQEAPETIRKVAQEFADRSGGKLQFEVVDPTANGAPLTQEALLENYAIRPIAASLFSDRTYYLYLLLDDGEQPRVFYPPADLSEATVRTALESALKRLSPDF
ncbi:MAG: hypothetical protein KatS3mg115_2054 [Candidatus Poribacteria bacterium]|nr:MAG: hypothetical protein KatS3mg115_2054 [Candidatus Poribacteria bacterium]